MCLEESRSLSLSLARFTIPLNIISMEDRGMVGVYYYYENRKTNSEYIGLHHHPNVSFVIVRFLLKWFLVCLCDKHCWDNAFSQCDRKLVVFALRCSGSAEKKFDLFSLKLFYYIRIYARWALPTTKNCWKMDDSKQKHCNSKRNIFFLVFLLTLQGSRWCVVNARHPEYIF